MPHPARITRTACLRWLGLLLVAGSFLAAPACRLVEGITDGGRYHPSGPFPVEHLADIPYNGSDSQEEHHLDLYLPRGQKDFPIVVFVHGGGWRWGDKDWRGYYGSVAEFLASQGIGTVSPNYRLSPRAKHPHHICDLARAVAWTQAHIADYGGRPDQLFLAGHSAGGHLVSLLATDERYLRDVGLCTDDIRGVIAVGGVYRIPDGKLDLCFGGDPPNGYRISQTFPLRGRSDMSSPRKSLLGGIPFRLDFFSAVFGDDPKVRAEASPINHVRPGLPPFLLFSADNDLPFLPAMAEEFCAALRKHGCDAQLLVIPGRNHNALMCRAIRPDDPVARAMVEFIGNVLHPTPHGTAQP
jgi:acetyl esterase/lipase